MKPDSESQSSKTGRAFRKEAVRDTVTGTLGGVLSGLVMAALDALSKGPLEAPIVLVNGLRLGLPLAVIVVSTYILRARYRSQFAPTFVPRFSRRTRQIATATGIAGIVALLLAFMGWPSPYDDRAVSKAPRLGITPAATQGAQSSTVTSTPVPSFTGTLAVIEDGKAVILKELGTYHREISEAGRLDGRVFEISSDGSWLLFTADILNSSDSGLNSLWVVSLADDYSEPINLQTNNIIHHASFVPNSEQTISFSTALPSTRPPGWQANNDLQILNFSVFGPVSESRKIILESSSGGVFGWWGTDFYWSPGGKKLAFANPSGIGLIDFSASDLQAIRVEQIKSMVPYNTRSDWAVLPGVTWGADGNTLYAVEHGEPVGLEHPEDSPLFNLLAISLERTITVVDASGMFSSPISSRQYEDGSYRVAYLEAQAPLESANSLYHLMVFESRDLRPRPVYSSGTRESGLYPQRMAWSPADYDQNWFGWIAVIIDGNVWIIDVESGDRYQLTNSGSAIAVDWK